MKTDNVSAARTTYTPRTGVCSARRYGAGVVLGLALFALHPAQAVDGPASAPNGLQLPPDYRNWRLISVAHRTDKQSLRAILGNDIAVTAARGGPVKNWPEGTILAKVAWKERIHDNWAAAIVPGELTHVEIMVKNKEKFAGTGGWGYARWLGTALAPYGTDAHFANECFQCHTGVKDTDYVFTRPPALP